jgi:hypothetical protein
MHSRGLPQPLPPYNGASSFWEINYVSNKILGIIRIFSFGFRTIYYFLYYCFILEHIYTRNIHVYPFHQQVVSEATKDGLSPMHFSSDSQFVRFLLQHNADLLPTDNKGRTPLHFAVEINNLKVLKSFCKKCINIDLKDEVC